MFCSFGTLHKACQCVSLIGEGGHARQVSCCPFGIPIESWTNPVSTSGLHIRSTLNIYFLPSLNRKVKQGAGTDGYLQCSHPCCFKKSVDTRWKCQVKGVYSHFEHSDGTFPDISLPRINIDSCLLSCEALWVTGSLRAFTVLPLPVSVFPTNAAGGLLVSVTQDECSGIFFISLFVCFLCRHDVTF